MKAVFDTNILIDYLNGFEAARKEIALYQLRKISVITFIEWINCESTCLARPWNFCAETKGGGRASLCPGLAIGGLVEAESISFLSRAIPLP